MKGKNTSSAEGHTEGRNNQPQEKESRYNNVVGILIFMAFLTIPYIYNSHLTDRKYRKADKIKAEMIELRSEFITLKSEIVGENKQSDVARKLSHRGISELTESPINLNPIDEH